jgi:hypothetical protein
MNFNCRIVREGSLSAGSAKLSKSGLDLTVNVKSGKDFFLKE